MNSFFKSTQYKNWIKTKDEIQKIHKLKIEKILKRIGEVNLLIKKENEQKTNPWSMEIEGEQNSINNIRDFKRYINPKKLISLDNEQALVISYSKKLIKILNSQKDKSTTVKSTTITYFRRFFLKKSILDYDPIYLMGAALYLGSKVSQLTLSIPDLEKIFPILKGKENILFEYEFYLSTILDYDFYVYSPYEALFGFLYTLEQKDFFLAQSSENYVNPNDFKKECSDIIDKMHLTDNIFLYSYSEIALASVFIKCEEKKIDIINIAEKLELEKVINVKEFLEVTYRDMKENYELIPKYESEEDEENKIKEIYKKVHHFHKSFPIYQTQLDKERDNFKKKMKEFTEDFEVFEKPILKALNKK